MLSLHLGWITVTLFVLESASYPSHVFSHERCSDWSPRFISSADQLLLEVQQEAQSTEAVDHVAIEHSAGILTVHLRKTSQNLFL